MTRAFLTVIILSLLCGGIAFAETHGRGYVPPANWDRIFQDHLRMFPVEKDPLPEIWDWREMNGTTIAKNQGSCGSCWAFAATGEMEAKVRIYYNRVLDLSEQQILSCNPYGSGCDGGWAGSAYYVYQHRGGVTEDCMPYESNDALPCTDGAYHKFANLDSWYSVANDVNQIKQALLEGPVCSTIDANAAFEGYSGGCLDAPGGWTNHLILIVGWDDRACDNTGAWIIKNSWGPGWGYSGFGYVQYGACSIGSSVTALRYTPPEVDLRVTGPLAGQTLYGDGPVDITWVTFGGTANLVDIWYGTGGWCQSTLVAENAPNTGSYNWVLPNINTDRGTFLVFPAEGTQRGYGFSLEALTVIGHQTRYVSPGGANIYPYDSPARASRTIAAAVLAGAGRDTVKVAGGEYLESVSVNSPCVIVGGYNSAFTVHNPAAYHTRMRGVTGALRFSAGAGDHCGVSDFTFHDCVGGVSSEPVPGYHGAAILSLGASPVIKDCGFEDNRANLSLGAGWGGAILLHHGAPVVRNCVFTNNIGSHGGAIAVSQSAGALIEDCGFTGNACSDSSSGYNGAAVYVSGGSATLRDCVLTGNGSTGLGGGVSIVAGGQVALENCDLTGNRARQGGGGVHLGSGSLTAVGGKLRHNSAAAGNGGGVLAESGDLDLRNLLLEGNQAASLGGGVSGLGIGGGAIENCVVAANSAPQGGGMMVLAGLPFTVRHNIVTGNTGGGLFVAGAALITDYNICWQNGSGDFVSTPGAHDLVIDPRLTNPATGDYALGLHSPALDTGDPDPGCEDPDASPADLGMYGGPLALPVAPPAVTGAGLTDLGGGAWRVHWTASSAPDIASYIVYRDTTEVFTPSADKAIAVVNHPATIYTDTPPYDCYYLVVARDADGHVGGYSARVATESAGTPVMGGDLPTALAITGLAPNPFNPRTTIAFDVPRAAHVNLRIYDLRGRLVAEPLSGDLTAGRHTLTWNGQDHSGRAAAAGVYLVRLDDGLRQVTAKAVLAK